MEVPAVRREAGAEAPRTSERRGQTENYDVVKSKEQGSQDPFCNRDITLVMDTPKTRSPHVILAFLAGILGIGLGYLYVGKLRLGVATIVAFCLTIGFFAWTRLIVQSATMLWLVAAFLVLIGLVALIHPIVLAARGGEISAKQYNRRWIYLIWSLGTALLGPTVYFSRATVLGYETFRVASSAMSPTLETGELFVSDSWRYHNHAVTVGEIVVFERPESPGVKYIKRVVAVAGDAIELRDGVLYRNGREVRESYLHGPMPFGGKSRNVALSTLGPGQIYVLGDYRDNSVDSRQWGPFTTESLRGRVQYIWLSIENGKIRWQRTGTQLVPQN
jgi:signal peptidase I